MNDNCVLIGGYLLVALQLMNGRIYSPHATCEFRSNWQETFWALIQLVECLLWPITFGFILVLVAYDHFCYSWRKRQKLTALNLASSR